MFGGHTVYVLDVFGFCKHGDGPTPMGEVRDPPSILIYSLCDPNTMCPTYSISVHQ